MKLQIPSLNLFLEDNNPFGRIRCTISYWTGTAYKIPREKFEPRSDYKLCFFFSDKPSVHIGAGAEDWTDAVIFVDKSLEPRDITFLEHKFYELARAANRYEITNARTFTRPNISAAKERDLENFAEYVRIIVGIFGFKVFEPAAEIPTPPAAIPAEEPIFYLSRHRKDLNFTVSATGKKINAGFVVLAGSTLAPTISKKASKIAKDARKRAKIENNILKKDMLFNTPTGAAIFVTGMQSENGKAVWKTKDGVPYGEIFGDDDV